MTKSAEDIRQYFVIGKAAEFDHGGMPPQGFC